MRIRNEKPAIRRAFRCIESSYLESRFLEAIQQQCHAHAGVNVRLAFDAGAGAELGAVAIDLGEVSIALGVFDLGAAKAFRHKIKHTKGWDHFAFSFFIVY
ncbi:MAG: hypothetical protein IPL70_05965 [Uliginosibacterium sp.]|nr:hypothetical protein [Uliginosibacterium sp.]